jgi:hypothetical protein
MEDRGARMGESEETGEDDGLEGKITVNCTEDAVPWERHRVCRSA